jgi:hypothetical protein
MIEIARVAGTSSASPREFFARWCDLDTHAEWSTCMEYLRLAEPFAVGARGELKSLGGDPAPFEVTEVVPDRVYADTTMLDGARLTVRHEAQAAGSGTDLRVTATLDGPLEGEWATRLGDGVERDIAADLTALTILLEGA